MAKTKIYLEDNGQDFLVFTCSEGGMIIKTEPFQGIIWDGGVIPVYDDEMVAVGKPCPIHKPPHIVFGYLKHKIEKIETFEI